jgi:hypothetical protein
MKIVVIHADCDDLRFLRPLEKELSSLDWAEIDWRYLNSMHSHDLAKEAIRNPMTRLVCIFLHGRSDGFRAGDYDDPESLSHPAMFLKRGEMGIFKGKAVFCLSCKGNLHAAEAIDGGAIAYLGFDDVPFYRFDPETEDKIPQSSLTLHCQGLIKTAAQEALYRFVCVGETMEEVASFTQLWVRQKAVEFIRTNPNEEYRNDVPHMFLIMADTVSVAGDKHVTWEALASNDGLSSQCHA